MTSTTPAVFDWHTLKSSFIRGRGRRAQKYGGHDKIETLLTAPHYEKYHAVLKQVFF
jgi:hypothetical protein